MNGGKPRGCGKARDKGGIYLECGSAEGFGLPMFSLIKDPIPAFDPDSVGLSPVGVKIVEVDGVYHVFDWVGAKHYPNAADFLEEAVRLGLSRRISRKEDFSKLTAESRLILVHPKAYVENDLALLNDYTEYPCPTGKHQVVHSRQLIREAGALWLVGDEDTVEGPSEGLVDPYPEWAPCPIETGGPGIRKMPAFEYRLAVRPKGITLSPGIVIVAPIERLVVVNDPEDPKNLESSLGAASASSLPVSVDEE